jgi:hypothetical protein
VVLNDAPPVLRNEVVARGRCLLARTSGERAEFEIASLSRHLDFQPVHRTRLGEIGSVTVEPASATSPRRRGTRRGRASPLRGAGASPTSHAAHAHVERPRAPARARARLTQLVLSAAFHRAGQ